MADTRHGAATGSVFAVTEEPILVLAVDDATVVDANPAAGRLLGRDPVALADTPLADLGVPDADAPPVCLTSDEVRVAVDAAREGDETSFQWRVARPDADPRWVDARLVRTDHHGTDRLLAFLDDVTERRDLESRLRERERRVDALFDAPEVLIGILDADGTLQEANATARRLAPHHADPDDELGTPFWETAWWAHDEALQDRLRDGTERACAGETVEFEATHQLPDGETMAIDVALHPVFDDGTVDAIVAHGIDTTERERREAEANAQRRRLETMLDTLPLVLFGTDADGVLTLSRGKGLASLGVEPGELVGQNLFDVYADFPEATEHLHRALDGEPVTYEAEIMGADYRTHVRPRRDDDGTVSGVTGVAIDVTERRRQERLLEALSRSTRRLMYPATPAAVAEEVVAIVEDVLHQSLATVRLYDADQDRLVPVAQTDGTGSYLADTATDELPERGPDTREMDVFEDGRFTVLDDLADDRDRGPEVDGLEEVVLVPLGDHGLLSVGTTDGVVLGDGDRVLLNVLRYNATAAMDRADREQRLETYQAELERSNERLQEFAYVASHDLQEPLRMVSSYVDLLAMEYGDALDEEAQEYVEYAVNGADRMRSMIDALLRYSRVDTDAGEFEPVDLDALLADVRRNLSLRIQETDADLAVDDLPSVRGDRDQLGQVFQNLVANAIEHAGETAPSIRVTGRERDDDYAFSVSDDGVGIPEDQQDAIFEIFNKFDRGPSDDDGTGIGLAVVERIVNRHGGDIWVESTPDEGATFTFTVPKRPGAVVADGGQP
jgi:PAS domain S-box-containing protein